MNKVIILSTIFFATNTFATDLDEKKSFNLKNREKAEIVQEINFEKTKYDTLGKKKLTIDEVYKKFSDPKEAERYIRVNEMGFEFEKMSVGKE